MRRRMNRIATILLLFCAVSPLVPQLTAAGTIATVAVGNPGNPNDTTGFGGVAYEYRIGDYEVSNDQYAEFLNAKAKSDPLGLYNTFMGNSARGGIMRSGVDGGYTYTVKTNMSNKPVNYVSWYDAVRFVNWLHNGQGNGDTETGSYTLLGGTRTPANFAAVSRNRAATWVLPTENEWYKAAYCDPRTAAQGGPPGDDNYWLYPTSSDSAPSLATASPVGDISNPGVNVANYGADADWNLQDGNVTSVGSAGSLSKSFYGTHDQGGNVWEWHEQAYGDGSRHTLRGGDYGSTPELLHLSSSYQLPSQEPTYESIRGVAGFRVALVTPPQPQIGWLIEQQNTNTWLVDSYENDGQDAAWIYDQALAVIAFADAGEVARAAAILNAMSGLQLTTPVGAWHECYNSSNTSIVVEDRLNSGPIAWMVMAVNFYESRTGDTNYAGVAQRALNYLDTMRDMNLANETYAALRYADDDMSKISTEHNLDAYSAYLYRGLLNSDNAYLTTASNILEYLAREMWALSTNSNGPYTNVAVFWDGWHTNQAHAFNTDPQSWGVLALSPIGPHGEEFYRCMQWIWSNQYGNTRCVENFNTNIMNVDGFKSGTGEGTNYIWVEGTEGVAAAFRRVGDYAAGVCRNDMAITNHAHAHYFHQQMARTTNANGGLVHSFSDYLDSDYRFPENARWNHVASVAWFYFSERGINPFAPPILHRGPTIIRLANGTNGPVEIGWQSDTNRPYKLRVRSDLQPDGDRWHDYGASFPGNGGWLWVPDCAPLQTQRFYRVLLGK